MKRNIFGLLAGFLTLQILVGIQTAEASDCSNALRAYTVADLTRYLKAIHRESTLDLSWNAAGELQMKEAAVERLRRERDALRTSTALMESQFPDTAHAVDQIRLAQMTDTNVILFGETSSGKSSITRALLQHAFESSPELNLFAELGVNINTRDSQLVGFINVNGREELSDIVVVPYTSLDEIDKAGAWFFSSVFPYLNEGQFNLNSRRLRAARVTSVATSNATAQDLATRIFPDATGSFVSGRALLGRFELKAMLSDWTLDPIALRERLLRTGLPQPLTVEPDDTIILPKFSKMPRVNMLWLKNLFRSYPRAFPISEDATTVQSSFLIDLRKKQPNLVEKSGDDQGFLGSERVNNKTAYQLANQMIRASFFLDLLKLPEEILSTKALIRLMEMADKMPLDNRSLFRLAHLFTTRVPGTIKLGDDAANPIDFDTQSFDQFLTANEGTSAGRSQALIGSERTAVNQALADAIQNHRAAAQQVMDTGNMRQLLAELRKFGLDLSPQQIESPEVLLKMLQGAQ